jgi:hypothetical protein
MTLFIGVREKREEWGVSDGDEISAHFLDLWTGRTPP